MSGRGGEDFVTVKLPEGVGSLTLVDGPFAVKLEGLGPHRITRMEFEHFSRRKGGAPFEKVEAAANPSAPEAHPPRAVTPARDTGLRSGSSRQSRDEEK